MFFTWRKVMMFVVLRDLGRRVPIICISSRAIFSSKMTSRAKVSLTCKLVWISEFGLGFQWLFICHLTLWPPLIFFQWLSWHSKAFFAHKVQKLVGWDCWPIKWTVIFSFDELYEATLEVGINLQVGRSKLDEENWKIPGLTWKIHAWSEAEIQCDMLMADELRTWK